MRRTTALIAGLALAAPFALCGPPAASGTALAVAPVHAASGDEESYGDDFNRDGYSDMAVAVPGEDLDGVVDAGAVQILYGTSRGLGGGRSQLVTQDTPGVSGITERGDRFGESIIVSDFDGDGYSDLAVGVPYENIGTIADAGVVQVLFGSALGLTGDRDLTLDQSSSAVTGSPERGDRFGWSLLATSLDGYNLLVGVPYEDLGSLTDAGSAYAFGYHAGFVEQTVLTQDTENMPGTAETGDRFGYSMSEYQTWLAIGVPYEDIGDAVDAGIVNFFDLEEDMPLVNSPGMDQGAESKAGDHYGLAVAPGYVGIPGKDDGAAKDVGAVNSWSGNRLALPANMHPAAGDRFGATVASVSCCIAAVAVGLPGRDVDGKSDAGAVYVTVAGSPDQLLTQGGDGVAGSPETGDGFGSSLRVSSSFELVIGTPSEDIGSKKDAGRVHVVRWLDGSNASTDYSQDSPGVAGSAEAGDRFGAGR